MPKALDLEVLSVELSLQRGSWGVGSPIDGGAAGEGCGVGEMDAVSSAVL